MTRRSITAVLGSVLVALFVTVQFAAASIAPSVDGSCVGYRFLEANMSTPPNGIIGTIGPSVVTVSQQRFIERNTTDLPNAVAADVSSPIITQAQQRF